jgi:hypothetical protein
LGGDDEMGGIDPLDVATRLAALPDRAMRAARLGELLERSEPHQCAWLLDALASVGRGGGPPCSIGLLAAVDLVGSDRLGYELRRAIYDAAESRGLAACKDLLFEVECTVDSKAAAPRALVPGARPLTLGERKSLARSWRRDVLTRLITDPHVDVVERLLANTHLTEDDVLRIATARRSSAAVLALLLRSPKWSRSPRIRRALVRNPRLPLQIALRLVGLLDSVELRDISKDAHLAPQLRAALDRRLRPPS